MSSDWPVLTLGDVCEKITDGAHNSPKSVDSGKPMASVKDLTQFGVDLSCARLIAIEEFEKLVKQGCQPEVGDVLVAKDGNSALDTVCTVDEPLDAVMLSSVAILRPNKEKLDSDFLKYYFCSRQVIDYLKGNFISGAAIPRVVLKDFRKAEIKVPPLAIQKEIAKNLRMLDDKIKLNHQTNQTLENIAQAIFKSWFVDFDPTRAKIAAKENGQDPEIAAMAAIAGKEVDELGDLSDEKLENLKTTAALFPDRFVVSELGEIPAGWEVESFSKVAKLDTTSVKPSKEPEKLWEHFSIPAYDVDESPRIEFGEDIKSNKYKVDTNAILTSKLNPSTPRTWWPDIEKENSAICSTEFMQFVPHNPEYKAFTLGLILSKPFQEGILQRVTGSTGSRQRAQPPQVANMEVVLPTEALVKFYSNRIESLYVSKAKRIKENSSLAKIQDTLLPKLLSGELNISSNKKAIA